ncbi:MAG: OmpA family protein [Polyangiaceae bacterium]|nr:OmpA family protein [Polyangiaceae bacterium]
MMRYRTLHCAAAVVLWAGVAQAQTEADASGDASFSLGDEMSTEDSADASESEEVSADAAATKTAPPGDEPSNAGGYKPEGNVWEVGLFGGLFVPSGAHKLGSVPSEREPYKRLAYEIGGRLAYFPLSWMGIEGEFMMADGRTRRDLGYVRNDLQSNRVNFFAYRGHLVFQVPLPYVVPFVLGGAEALGTNSQPTGRDADTAFQAGGGLKVPFGEVFSLRADFRENMHRRRNDEYQKVAFSEEVLLGLTFTLGRSGSEPPAPPADSDKDGVPDNLDTCPDTPAVTSDGCPPDTDGDGVRDPDDYCPREKGQAPKGCPDLDADKDSILLPCDQCPEEAGVAPDGCPVRDTDGDGIMDDVDKCPKEPETKNGYEDTDGCPDEIPREVQKFTGAIQGITFDRGKATIRRTSEATLRAAVDVLKKYPSIRLEITGHTSSEGAEDFNLQLSEERAAAVRMWLLDHDIQASRVVSRGAGESEPVDTNATEAGRRKNRRIEFKILTQ